MRVTDTVGTLRGRWDLGSNWDGACTSFPYGDAMICSVPPYSTALFTGKERDNESGLDYFGARYYSSSMGRFLSPDPSFDGAVLEVPQTWNEYSYVYNNPLLRTDPDGRCPICIGAVVGGVVKGGYDLGRQLYYNGGSFGDVSWGEVGANVVGGAIAGTLAVATGGASLVESEVIGDVAAGATSSIAGGVVTRTLDPNTNANDVLSASKVSVDALAGLAGGLAGHKAAEMIHVPDEPSYPRSSSRAWKTRARMAAYNAQVANRTRAISAQAVRAGVTSALASHAISTGVSYMWTFFTTPEDRSSVTTSQSYSIDCTKNPGACK